MFSAVRANICVACDFCTACCADSISAPSAVLMESSTGKVLFEKNPHEQRPCASVTKVMTLLLVFEAVDSGKLSLDDEITASEHAAGMGGSDIWLEKGETMSADDMIKATVVVSANDAAGSIAGEIRGRGGGFVGKKNKRGKKKGKNETPKRENIFFSFGLPFTGDKLHIFFLDDVL